MNDPRRKFKNQEGFNLIELMIVIAIIALLVAVGIPAWGAMVRSGNEASAAQTIQTIRTCQASFSGKNKGRFAAFADLVKSGCLDGDKFSGEQPVVAGYIFQQKVEEPSGTKPAFYSVNADPQVSEGVSRTGDRHFYFDSSLGAVKVTDENRPAKADDPSM
jgi:prepilin-type N-terminal cleavage/methylation domain-containing protein